jgi:hypothetical protein
MAYGYSGDMWGTFLVSVVVSILVTWLIIYTAVAAGVGHAIRSTAARLTADANVTAVGVEFIVTNVGTGPAFDLSVRWLGAPADAVLARSPLLQERSTLRWVMAAAPAGSGEAPIVRQLQLTWRPRVNPDDMRKAAFLAVLVPPALAN